MYSSSHYDPVDTTALFVSFLINKASFFQQYLPSSKSIMPLIIKSKSFTEAKRNFHLTLPAIQKL